MIKKLIGSIALSVLLAANANAASMSIVAPNSVLVGDQFQLEIWGNFFDEGLIAGAITFQWDNGLVVLDNITINLPVDSDLSCPGSVNCPPNTVNSAPILWGEFLNDLIVPFFPAPALMATLTFTAIAAPGLASFSMIDNPALSGGWFGAGYNPIDTPAFGGASVGVVVPLPAAVWFMIGGLSTLLGFRRRETT